MAAPVRVEAAALSDPRIDLLGQLAGYSRYEALGRLTHLWSACTEKQFYVATEVLVRACIGPAGVQHLLDAELAERVEGGLRVKGTAGRIEWHGEYTEKRSAAGAVRAATAQRDAKGRMVSSARPASESAGPAHPAHAGQETDAQDLHIQHTSTRPAHAGHAGPSTSSTVQRDSSGTPAKSSAITLTTTITTTPVPESISGSAPASPVAEKAKPARKRQMPPDWVPTRNDANLRAEAAAVARGINLGLELTKARDWASSNAATKADWDGFWRNWTRNAKPTSGQTSLDRQLDRVRMLQAQEAAAEAAEGES